MHFIWRRPLCKLYNLNNAYCHNRNCDDVSVRETVAYLRWLAKIRCKLIRVQGQCSQSIHSEIDTTKTWLSFRFLLWSESNLFTGGAGYSCSLLRIMYSFIFQMIIGKFKSKKNEARLCECLKMRLESPPLPLCLSFLLCWTHYYVEEKLVRCFLFFLWILDELPLPLHQSVSC